MRSFPLLAAALVLMAASPPSSPLELVAAERAFADHVRERGAKAGFLAFAAPDAIMFQGGPVDAARAVAAWPDREPPGPPLQWWPEFVGIARSGDLGFTTGPASIPVRYFSVWRRQPNGGWKWIYDGGTPLRERLAGGPDTRPEFLAVAADTAGSAQRALAEIAPLEARIAEHAATDAKAAHLAFLAEDGLAGGPGHASQRGRAGQAAALDARPAAMRLNPQGSAASTAGDMAFTRGEARWDEDGRARWGHYARIWQKRPEGWRMIVDLLIPERGEPPVAPAPAEGIADPH